MLTKTLQILSALILLSSMSTLHASLIGDTVGCNIGGGGTFTCSASTSVVGGGAEFGVGTDLQNPVITVDISANSISLFFNGEATLGQTIINLTDLDWVDQPGQITGITLIATDNLFNLSQSDLSFTADSVSINLVGVEFNSGRAEIGLTVNHGATAVPEPLMISLFGLGFVLLGFQRKHITT